MEIWQAYLALLIDEQPMTSDKTYLVAANIPSGDWSFEFGAVPKVVGRGSGADVRIRRNSLGVSRKHASFWTNGSHWLEDLGSSFGTFVNRVKLIPRQKTSIVVGDQILLGKMELHVVSGEGLELMKELEKKTVADSEDSISVSSIERMADQAIPVIPLKQSIISELTKSEHEIVIWLMRGVVSEAEIAKRTFRSPNTIRTHMNNIYRKLNVHTRHELMAILLRGGMGDSDSE